MNLYRCAGDRFDYTPRQTARAEEAKVMGDMDNETRQIDGSHQASTPTRETASVMVPPDYKPSEAEPYMNPVMLEYFRRKLLAWKASLLAESNETLSHLQESTPMEPDIADRASRETDRSLELRTRDRERKLISKIDSALERVEDGSYGYCDELGEPIGIRRLEARPNATLSLEAQERHERRERTQRDD